MGKHREPEKAHIEHINQNKMAHMIGVAEWMRERAEDYGLDSVTMYTLGLLHDIGYIEGRENHEQRGAEILASMGMSKEMLFAVKHHGENPYEIQRVFGEDAISSMLVLMQEADLSIDALGYRVGFDKRLDDIKKRYGDSYREGDLEDTIRFIEAYQTEHGIEKPTRLFHEDLHHNFDKDVDYKRFWSKENAPNIQRYESDTAIGLQVDVTVTDYYQRQYTAEMMLIETTDHGSPVPYFYLQNASESLFENSPLKAALEKAGLEAIASSDSPEVSDTAKDFAKSVLKVADQILEKAEMKGFKEFEFPVETKDGIAAISIKPCCDYEDGVIEFFLTNDDRVDSNDTAYELASDAVKIDSVERSLEEDKAHLQSFYETKIAHCIDKPRETLTQEERDNLSTFSDWHKDVYHHRPYDDRNECRKIMEQRGAAKDMVNQEKE